MIGEGMFGEPTIAGDAEGGAGGWSNWIEMLGALGDAIAFGPNYITDSAGLPISSPGVYVVPFSLELVDRATPLTVISALPDTFSRSFNDENNDTGAASFAFAGTDSSAFAAIDLGLLVNNLVYGVRAFTMLVESMHRVSVTAGEEHDQIVVVNGRGHLALWEDAVMYPARGVDSLPIEEDRVFNWTSLVYDDAGWGYAKQIIQQSADSPAWGGDPTQWVDPTAFWIWAYSGDVNWAPPGACYFRKFFTVPVGVTQIALYYAMDNRGKVYVDGLPMAEQSVEGPEFSTKFVTVDVTPGVHLIAVEVINDPGGSETAPPPVPVTHTVVTGDTLWALARRYYGSGLQWRIIYNENQAQIQADATTAGLWNPYDPGHWIFPGQVFTIPGLTASVAASYNPGGLIVSVYEATEGAPTNLLVHTDSSWKIVPYPADPPGMTPGQVIRLALHEATDRGGLADLVLAFNDVTDSAGNAWPVVADIATKVGTSYLTFLIELTSTYIDLWMAPGTTTLYAWNRGSRNAVTGVTLHAPTDVDDPTSGNIYELAHTVLG